MHTLLAAAPNHVPGFITAPGETDLLMLLAGVTILAAILGIGVFFLWLHSLPERMVHNKLQYDLVAVLALLSLFTHQHAFWIAALLLAFVNIPEFKIPDFHGPLRHIANSLHTMAKASERPAPSAHNEPTSKPAAAAKAKIVKDA